MKGRYRRQMVLDYSLRYRPTHGGEHSVGRRKGARPIALKRAMHLVMWAESARGSQSLLTKKNANLVRLLVAQLSTRWEVKVYEWANSGNHLHLLVKARTRKGFQGFLRSFSGRLAMAITGARKGRPLGKRFWDLLAFSRIVEWGRPFEVVRRYVQNNLRTHLAKMPSATAGPPFGA